MPTGAAGNSGSEFSSPLSRALRAFADGEPSGSAGHGSPPPVPGQGHGVYLGAYNPKSQGLGHLAIVHSFAPWGTAPSTAYAQVKAIAADGSIPLLDWDGCPANSTTSDLDQEIAAGDYDIYIYNFASQLAAFGGPMFLRWFWEMNLKGHQGCAGGTNKAHNEEYYTKAWIRMWAIFHGEIVPPMSVYKPLDVRNVSFVWCPDVAGTDWAKPAQATQWFPGEAYVDWIGADGFTGSKTFPQLFGSWYNWAEGEGKPLMIGATGADQ